MIGADLVPTKSNILEFQRGDIKALFGDQLIGLLNSVDYRIVNLEVPLTDVATPILKSGPVLNAPTSSIHAFSSANIDLVTLANNHIMDQGKDGLNSTIKVLNDAEIAYVGAGEDIETARMPYIINTFSGEKIGIFACAEHEFSIAEENFPGANPFDPLESFDDIRRLREECNYIIVLFHGGNEEYRYPSPRLQKICRKFIENGANVVITQHSHCIGCREEYQNGVIVYGQGNFLFDYSSNECWMTSILVAITISNGKSKIEYIPLIKFKNGVRLAGINDRKKIIEEFKKRSKEILSPDFVKDSFSRYSSSMIEDYLYLIYRRNVFFRALNKLHHNQLIKRLPAHVNRKALLALQNDLQCESHSELMINGLKDKIGGN